MIPPFPQFKKLELSDKNDVDLITRFYPPYSDFNFAGTWSSDTSEGLQISQLHGNYVIRFLDYFSREPFYTFLGDNHVNETLIELFNRTDQESLPKVLKLIPEFCLSHIDQSQYVYEEDRNNFDYIYDLEELSSLAGSKFSKKRNHVSSFLKQYSHAEAVVLDLGKSAVRQEMIDLHQRWVQGKQTKDTDWELEGDDTILKKLLSAVDEFQLKAVGVYIGEHLVAFSLRELVHQGYMIAHVAKAEVHLPGANAFLMQESARLLLPLGARYLNAEQDLGRENLRLAKERFRPCRFLKKYKIVLT